MKSIFLFRNKWNPKVKKITLAEYTMKVIIYKNVSHSKNHYLINAA